jgi:serine/threonine protein kinase
MMWSKKKKPPVDCPSREQLEAFHLGRLPPVELADFVAHLDGCDVCESILIDLARKQVGLPKSSDSVPSDELLAELELRQLETAAAAITPRPPKLPRILSAYQAPQVPGYQTTRCLATNVYEARPEKTEDEVILRVLRGCVVRDKSAVRRLLAQSHKVARATEGCVLPVIDVISMPGFTVVAMPLVEAESLAQIIRRRRVGGDNVAGPFGALITGPDRQYLQAVIAILERVIRAVSIVHQRGDQYPDLRTSSVLLAANSSVCLDDFGMSCFRWPSRGGLSAGVVPGPSRYANELPDVFVAHPSFLAPEEWRMDRAVDACADVFRLGVLAYHALTLHLPYGDGSVSRRTKPPRPPSDCQPALSPELDNIILRALAIRPEERLEDAGEMHAAWVKHGFGA